MARGRVRRHPGGVHLLRVDPENTDAVSCAAGILEAARRVDDPDAAAMLPERLSGRLAYGWDLEPEEMYLYAPAGSALPVAVLALELPRRDNRHLVWADITVHPGQRRRGHGATLLAEVRRRAERAGRNTIWMEAAEDDLGGRRFLEDAGFRCASRDARRVQVLADLDWPALTALREQARRAAADYDLERGTLPTPTAVLEELVAVTAAINDAPMGDLTFEDEHFDLRRLQDFETAAAGRHDEIYRVWARHRRTGEIGGHTVVSVNPRQPDRGWQYDTAVRRSHRGHRLGLLLKLEMLHWLVDEQPQLELIETSNQADNRYMIGVNEALGYRLSRVFATYELSVDLRSPAGSAASRLAATP